ncbi:GNAT family N-acetyltransferase [Listeria grayi]|nr:GNAT family N-acetyltransferase [Listeria grayi]STY44089.1 Predicted acetyltransferase [Listeria grayi]
MIRKLLEKDHDEVIALLKSEAALNVFLIGDILSFGYDSDIQEVWGDFDDTHSLRAVLVKFGDNFLPYAKNDAFDVAGLAEKILAYENPILTGASRVTTMFEKYMPELAVKRVDQHFCECEEASRIKVNTEVIVRTSIPEDIPAIIEMRANIKELQPRREDKELMVTQLAEKTKRIYYIEQNGEIVAVAESSAENPYSAMIIGVATKAEYRKQGLAKTIMKKLSCDLLAEGKKPCLFYSNPVAGAIYEELGFVKIGNYAIYK